jgi:hypothetical protein
MQRLETAYVNVQEALTNQPQLDQVVKPPVKSPVPAPILEPAQPQPSTPVVLQPQPVVSLAESESSEPIEESVAASKFSPISAGQTQSIASEIPMDSRPLAPIVQSEKRAPAEPNQQPEPSVPEARPRSSVPQKPMPSSAWGPETDTVIANTSADNNPVSIDESPSAPAKYQPSPLAQSETQLQTPQDLPEAVSTVAGDPLYTQLVDDGLNQLLTDWTLFKKSGLFGTGPKGMNHPLYLKIKDLQIPLLLAGRFEGATQEIKQSITDYMNGWRYEQGIVYEQGENFDHYLRRVINHILDLHKKA